MSEDPRKRWLWDLCPLAKDSWGAWELEPEMQRPDHRLYMYRTEDGSVMELDKLLKFPSAKVLHREAYQPTEEDFAFLRKCYPKADCHRPNWYTIKADLVVAGHESEKLDRAEAPVLLGLLRKEKGAAQRQAGSGNAKKESPPDAPARTLGALLEKVEACEAAYSQYAQVAERYEAQGSPVAKWWRVQAEISRFHPVSGHDPMRGWHWEGGDPINNTLAEWPGIDRLEAYCHAEFGTGITAANLRRIRGKLITDSGAAPSDIDGLTIPQLVDKLRNRPDKAASVFPWGRLVLWVASLLVLEGVAVLIAWRWGSGDNLLQKIVGFWSVLGIVFVAVAGASPLILGREGRRQIVKWWKGLRGD